MKHDERSRGALRASGVGAASLFEDGVVRWPRDRRAVWVGGIGGGEQARPRRISGIMLSLKAPLYA